MNEIIWTILLLIFFTGCDKDENTMELTGNVKGLKKGMILLKKAEDTLLVPIDSMVVDGDANFSFSEKVYSPELYFLQLKIENESLKDKNLSFFAEAGEIHISTTLEDFNTAAVISGSENQTKYSEYLKLVRRYTDRDLELLEEEFKALQEQNDSLQEAIQRKRQSILSGKYLATVNFAINNKDYELAPYLMLSEVYDANIKYLDTVYNSLTPRIKDSKYGKTLENYIQERRNLNE